MRLALRQFFLLLTVLLALACVRTGPVAAQETTAAATEQCRAATPVENPWTKGLPQGWWKRRHEDTLSAPGREETRIVFVGDSITDGWDSEAGGLKVWQREYVPKKALNLGIVCDSTQHVLWRLDHGAIDDLPTLQVVVIEIGTNNVGITRDPPEDIAKGVEAICERVKQKAPQARIILMGVFPRLYGRDNSDNLNRKLAEQHDGKRVFFVNINQTLTETEGAIADRVGHLGAVGYQIWADAIRDTIENLMAENVQYQAPVGVAPAKETTTAPGNQGGEATQVNPCRAATPARNMQSPLWYSKHFDIIVWGNRFERRRADLALLGSTVTYRFPQALLDKEYAPWKTYNLGMPNDCTEHVLWRIDNGAVDTPWSKLKLLVLEVGLENKRIHQDKAENIVTGIAAICDRVKANVPQAKILLMGVFPPGPDGDQHDDVNRLIAGLADGKQVFFLNINDALLKTPDALGKDGMMLTERGYEVWVEQMRPLVGELMKTKTTHKR